MDAVGIWLIVLVVLPFFLFFCRILLITCKSLIVSKRLKNLSSEIEARQAQVQTVSGSVDANSAISFDTPTTSQQASNVHIKDLPPTYEDAMKTFLDAKEAAAASSVPNVGAISHTEVRGTEFDIDDSAPPPRYSNAVQS